VTDLIIGHGPDEICDIAEKISAVYLKYRSLPCCFTQI